MPCADRRPGLVELRDIMPTLLDMAGIPIPDSVEGMSLLSETRRNSLYAEHYEDDHATRMIRDERFKLIYYSVGNHFQLFDLENDTCELNNLASDPSYITVRDALETKLIENLYGQDLNWVENKRLVGVPDKSFQEASNRGLTAQRGWRFM